MTEPGAGRQETTRNWRIMSVNEGLDSDFFKKQYPRLRPMSHEEYRNSPKRGMDGDEKR